MIISHQHRFIFFKVAKTAGTSLEIALSQFCGPDDVITLTSPEDEAIRTRLGFRRPQNFVLPPVRAGESKRKFFHHISAAKVKSMIDPWVWKHYYKFCVVRNPWDRVISEYWWQQYRARRDLSKAIASNTPLAVDNKQPSLSEFITPNKLRALNNKGFKIYTIDGAVVVDDIFYYEDLPGALDRLGDKLALPNRLVLPRAKTRIRKDRRPHWDVLSRREAECIAQVFAEEIQLHGYMFRETRPTRPTRQEAWLTPLISPVKRPVDYSSFG